MARPGSALLCVAAATVLVAAAVAFVGSPAGTHAPSTGRSVELGSRALPPAAESAAASGEAAAEQSGAESFMKWTAAG
eukprot:CAMPEP_0181524348 /NCGR_PEP_ID=MMETSP1110-20121109/68384_1 /TAXON_ID=174948 /ORGANISM="Symbiodinium sp., Strain CCMP421" /LENGTH=77 /DNA_ID=CAMNT_0023655075 /DNA_START=47 /DNA_END=277 /DNA_ORIENTATION=-